MDIATQLNQSFSLNLQQAYIERLQTKGGFTRKRAEYLVRLWTYLQIKHLGEPDQPQPPKFTDLAYIEAYVSCTHREAALLFYNQQERGSERSAGLMIDRFVSLGVLEKRFDGNTICLRVRPLPELNQTAQEKTKPQLVFDAFNPRTDAVACAQIITRTFNEVVKTNATTSHKVLHALRAWAKHYPHCMRVLRRLDTGNPVGITVLYPVTQDSEVHFFDMPSKTFFLSTDRADDPFTMATPGDPDCTSLYVRAWIIEPAYLTRESLRDHIVDTKAVLRRMQADYPELCDIYSLIIHPIYERLRHIMGFEKVFQESQRSYSWSYLAIERYLDLDAQFIAESVTQKMPETESDAN
jgi:hypothetical protein